MNEFSALVACLSIVLTCATRSEEKNQQKHDRINGAEKLWNQTNERKTHWRSMLRLKLPCPVEWTHFYLLRRDQYRSSFGPFKRQTNWRERKWKPNELGANNNFSNRRWVHYVTLCCVLRPIRTWFGGNGWLYCREIGWKRRRRRRWSRNGALPAITAYSTHRARPNQQHVHNNKWLFDVAVSVVAAMHSNDTQLMRERTGDAIRCRMIQNWM